MLQRILFMLKNKWLILLIPSFIYANSQCKLINSQCIDTSPSKTIGGVTYQLADACAANGLTGGKCCWDQKQKYYCGDSTDQCGTYRQNPNCKFTKNDCQNTDPLTGNCLLYKSTYSCATSYIPVESQLCTNAICVNNSNNTAASNCFLPNGTQAERDNAGKRNTNDLVSAISIIEMGKQAGDDLNINCPNPQDPKSCVIFQGDYYTCKIWKFSAMPNNGADCMLHNQYFTPLSAGVNASDKAVYGSTATGQTGYDFGSNSPEYKSLGQGVRPGDQFTYSLSNNDSRYVNKSVTGYQTDGMSLSNQNMSTPYNSNAKSSQVSLVNSQVSNVTIADSAANKIGFWDSYLTDGSIKLAWNRKKASPDPNNVKSFSFQELGVSRRPDGDNGHWGDDKPLRVEGLCVYLSNYCDGGDDKGTSSAYLKAISFGNAQACGVCTNSLFGECLTADPRDVSEEWCCYNSKLAMDMNLAAYDQGLTNLYDGSSNRYKGGGNVARNGTKCGGLSIEAMSRIDFSKGNYLTDFASQIDTSKFMNSQAVQGQPAQNSMQNRGNSKAQNIIINGGH
ncbi:MAG: hypothetical protein ORN24_04220 [Burkholderiales bacterium]|nr:hypothetical protein [Burkholderiales bacterium]